MFPDQSGEQARQSLFQLIFLDLGQKHRPTQVTSISHPGLVWKKFPPVFEEEVVSNKESTQENDYEDHTLEELQELLNKAVENEEYEKASLIRDEIKKRTPG